MELNFLREYGEITMILSRLEAKRMIKLLFITSQILPYLTSNPSCGAIYSSMQLKQSDRKKPKYPKRTLESIRQDYHDFVKAGSNKDDQASFHNVTNPPIFNIEPVMWCIAFLHITLGIVLRIHGLLIVACYALDIEIANNLAALNFPTGSSKYDQYISIKADILAIEEQLDELNEVSYELQDLCESNSASLCNIKQWDAELQQNKAKISKLEKTRDSLQSKLMVPGKESGPVVRSLDKTLNKHGIHRQAYHGKSFVGNHCHKYLQEEVYTDVLDGVIRQCELLTGDQDIIDEAIAIKAKFKEFFRLYSCIHMALSHSEHISRAELPEIQQFIDNFMKFCREKFPN